MTNGQANVTCHPRYDIHLQCQTDINLSPFDIIKCPLQVVPLQYVGNTIKLLPLENNFDDFVQISADLNHSGIALVSYDTFF